MSVPYPWSAFVGPFVRLGDEFDEPVTIRVFEVEERAHRPVEDLGEIGHLGEQIIRRVGQDSPDEPLARSTVNSREHDGHVTSALVCRRVLILR